VECDVVIDLFDDGLVDVFGELLGVVVVVGVGGVFGDCEWQCVDDFGGGDFEGVVFVA